SAAASRLRRKHVVSRLGSACPARASGPTVWITQRAGSSPAAVGTASPTGSPSGKSVARTSRHSARSAGPAAAWIAPSTPPPPRSDPFAALTIASTRSRVMSPSTASTSTDPVRIDIRPACRARSASATPGAASGADPGERLGREHDLDRHLEVRGDAKREVEARRVLAPLEVADRLVVHAERLGELAAAHLALGAQHRD